MAGFKRTYRVIVEVEVEVDEKIPPYGNKSPEHMLRYRLERDMLALLLGKHRASLEAEIKRNVLYRCAESGFRDEMEEAFPDLVESEHDAFILPLMKDLPEDERHYLQEGMDEKLTYETISNVYEAIHDQITSVTLEEL